MTHVDLKILADVEERASGIPAHLRRLGVNVCEVQLPSGDFVVGESDAVERKTVADLHRSIVSARLWRQIEGIRSDFERPYLLVEGVSLDLGVVSAAGVRGAVLHVIDQGVAVIWSQSRTESALWLRLLARRVQSIRPFPEHLRTGRRRRRASSNRVLSTIPGISEHAAHELLARFGTIASIAAATEQDLCTVPGIGRKRAETVKATLN